MRPKRPRNSAIEVSGGASRQQVEALVFGNWKRTQT